MDPDAQRAERRAVWPLKRRATHAGIRAREAINDGDAAHASPLRAGLTACVSAHVDSSEAFGHTDPAVFSERVATVGP